MMDSVQIITDEMPPPWCSCDPLRKAEAERDKYRSLALFLACQHRLALDASACRACERGIGSYCAAVIEEVDGE